MLSLYSLGNPSRAGPVKIARSYPIGGLRKTVSAKEVHESRGASSPGDGESAVGVEHSVAWILLVSGPAYILLGVALRASWALRSAPAVVAIAFMAAALAGVMCSDLAWFKAQGVGILVEAERKRRRSGSSHKTRRAAIRKGECPSPAEVVTLVSEADDKRTA